MRVATAITRWLIFGFLAGLFSIAGSASADILEVEPDAFPEGTDLANKFPGVTLTVEGHPGMQVLARDGTLFGGPNANNNLAPTGMKASVWP